ncbi:MAG: hypothetical protein AAFR52_01350 [Pseudomonadota bacterium]
MSTQSALAERMRGDEPTTAALGGEVEDFLLERHGKRPLAFSGSELCMATSYVAGTQNWFEINVYRTTDGGFIVRVDMHAKSVNERGMCDAWTCPSFGEVLDSLESYDAADCVVIDVAPDDHALSLADMAAHALALRARAGVARRQFRSIVGELLMELDG